MASTAITERADGIGGRLAALVAEGGSVRHPYATAPALLGGAYAPRNLADAAHFLCLLHGRYPGVIELAAQRVTDPAARGWINRAAQGFAAERAYLARLVVAVGPLPSTLGQARSEAAVTTQTHALATLAQSERAGCALGAALALVLDWRTMRTVLDTAAQRFGLQPPPIDLPDLGSAIAVAGDVATTPGIQRALAFGAEQLLIQHRGLWDLLETREMARRES
ncbi:hypothetical protein [uncultured Sphingomonas sp.]|uniref:DUF6975 family protein n=1 Tax=uncultured Sphingomonas sp. TaxID=158754 RepID=UPI002604DD00|nr:hypothetical protein [uncultured Sphingomonas sp.]